MVRLQRRTSLATAAFVALSLAAAGAGSGWYMASGVAMSIGSSPTQSAGLNAIEYGVVWVQAYLASLLATLLLIGIAAKGTRLICLAITLPFALAGPLLALVASGYVRA